jgi:hypothetical protein
MTWKCDSAVPCICTGSTCHESQCLFGQTGLSILIIALADLLRKPQTCKTLQHKLSYKFVLRSKGRNVGNSRLICLHIFATPDHVESGPTEHPTSSPPHSLQ